MSSQDLYSRVIYVNHWNNIAKKILKASNKIKTNKYTFYNFLPLVLYEQFQRISNFYFLLGMIINLVIDSPIPPFVAVFPLLMLTTIFIFSRLYESIRCYLSDQEVNKQKTFVFRNNRFVACHFEDLRVGDVVKILKNESFAADIIFLNSSRKDVNECSVTTVNLDGESNLKLFSGVVHIKPNELEEYFVNNKLTISVTEPVEDLYKFHGKLYNNDDYVMNLTEKNILLRGSKLKHTEYVIGCVVYVGAETKLSLNSKLKRTKISVADERINTFVLIILIFQILMSFICCLVWNLHYFTSEWQGKHWYIPRVRDHPWKRIEGIFIFFILFIRIVPISLLYTMYSIKGIASFFLNQDIELYDEKTNQRIVVNTIELVEELGQIEYLFTDKTGTLTENKMNFRCCSVGDNGVVYRDSEKDGLCLVDKVGDIGESLLKPFRDELMDLFICLSLCHSVLVTDADGSPNTKFDKELDMSQLDFQATSPDEAAFLEAMRKYGIVYMGSKLDRHYVFISHLDAVEEFQLLETLEFDPNRKCMSVIVKYSDGNYWLISKGAESSIFPKITEKSTVEIFKKRVTMFAEDGLRILAVAKRKMLEEEALKAKELLNYLRTSPQVTSDDWSNCFATIETDLNMVGVTGIEDKLQEDVQLTITSLREAGIKIWVITGDKEETAVNVSFAVGHFRPGMTLYRITKLDKYDHYWMTLKSILKQDLDHEFALIIDGDSFQDLNEAPLLLRMFMRCAYRAESVLCCRMRPIQKAQTVKLVRTNVGIDDDEEEDDDNKIINCNSTIDEDDIIINAKCRWKWLTKRLEKTRHIQQPITAAVGDGGNDVSMILEAHVGMAVFGKEGRQAVRVADYAFAKFFHLRRAILVHGQNSYERISTVILFYFYKSFIYVMPLFYFIPLSAASATTIYDNLIMSLYNITFTTMPIWLFGMLDKEKSEKERLENPYQYREKVGNKRLRYPNFIGYSLWGIFESLVAFLIVYICYFGRGFSDNYANDFIGVGGNTYDYLTFGIMIMYAIWIVVVVKVVLLTNYLTRFFIIGIILNAMVTVTIHIIYGIVVIGFDYYQMVFFFSEPFCYLTVIITSTFCIAMDVMLRIYRDRSK